MGHEALPFGCGKIGISKMGCPGFHGKDSNLRIPIWVSFLETQKNGRCSFGFPLKPANKATNLDDPSESPTAPPPCQTRPPLALRRGRSQRHLRSEKRNAQLHEVRRFWPRDLTVAIKSVDRSEILWMVAKPRHRAFRNPGV